MGFVSDPQQTADSSSFSAAFPPYRYTSDRERRPLADDPEGIKAMEEYVPEPLDPVHWRRCGVYLFAIELFNTGRYWEAHEEWEALWVLAGRQGVLADFLKGLIKLAAAGVKCREKRINGVARHAARGVELFGSVRAATGGDRLAGLSLADLIREAKQIQSDAEEGKYPGDPTAEVIYSFGLRPE